MSNESPKQALPRIMSRTPLPSPPPHDAATLAMVDAVLDQQVDFTARAALITPELIAARTAQALEQRERDWPGLARYRAHNADVRQPDLVMMGDSITEIWGHATPDLFGDKTVNRGISGQTSGQMLLRFYADVIDLKPRRVHLLCGTNDIAGNTGQNTPEDYQRNVTAMADLAKINGVAMIIGSLTPTAKSIMWSPSAEPLVWIPYLNDWLQQFTAARGLTYVDYYAALADESGLLREAFSGDGVHLSRAGYGVMRATIKASLGLR